VDDVSPNIERRILRDLNGVMNELVEMRRIHSEILVKIPQKFIQELFFIINNLELWYVGSDFSICNFARRGKIIYIGISPHPAKAEIIWSCCC